MIFKGFRVQKGLKNHHDHIRYFIKLHLELTSDALADMALEDMALEDPGNIFGTHCPACHVQHFFHQGNLASLAQYSLEGLPSFQTAPGHPFP